MTAKNEGAGYPLVMYPEDLARLRFSGSTGAVDMESLCTLVGEKVLRVILLNFHHKKEEEIRTVLPTVKTLSIMLNQDTPEHWGMLIEIRYRFVNRPKREQYRHVFHFVPSHPGSLITGRIYTHVRKYIAR